MANVENKIIVVLENPGGNMIERTLRFHENGGLQGAVGVLNSGHQIIAVYLVTDCGDVPEKGGPFWMEFSGHNMFSVQQDGDGVVVYQLDTTPTNSCEVRGCLSNGEVQPKRIIPSKIAQAAMGGGANWDTFEDGDGTVYENKIALARAAVGFPT